MQDITESGPFPQFAAAKYVSIFPPAAVTPQKKLAEWQR